MNDLAFLYFALPIAIGHQTHSLSGDQWWQWAFDSSFDAVITYQRCNYDAKTLGGTSRRTVC